MPLGVAQGHSLAKKELDRYPSALNKVGLYFAAVAPGQGGYGALSGPI